MGATPTLAQIEREYILNTLKRSAAPKTLLRCERTALDNGAALTAPQPLAHYAASPVAIVESSRRILAMVSSSKRRW